MEKVIAVVAALLLVGCEEPPTPKVAPAPSAPERREHREEHTPSPTQATAPKQYPPRAWQGHAISPPKWVMERMSPDVRRVWTAYASLPPERRTNQAWRDAYHETRGRCVSRVDCQTELEVLAGFVVQGWYEGAIPLWRGTGMWINPHRDRETCLGMFDELSQDKIASSPSTPFLGIFCGTVATSEATGETIIRDAIERKWTDR